MRWPVSLPGGTPFGALVRHDGVRKSQYRSDGRHKAFL